ncbi:galactose mutarotase [Eubacteriales bacterium OttesenSCG-928-N13]|nr:galactose mutarotase [Eubacteriales bacterium OttesenSCG-928-N13]
MSIEKKPFGQLHTGEKADLYILKNGSGAWVSITNYGGIITSIHVPGRDGKLVDVLLGANDVSGYAPHNNGYLGALIGRVGNRIGNGVAILNGQPLYLAKNSNGQHLHGGNVGFDRKLWSVKMDKLTNSLMLSYVSPDGEENYPGTLEVRVTYTWSERNALSIHYEATSDKDTLCNLTNHAYFNLNGEDSGSIVDHEIQIDADRLTVVDEFCIPTGELRDVTGTPFDLRKMTRIAEGLVLESSDEQLTFGGGYDHNFALNGSGYREIVKLKGDKTGIDMTVETDQPGVQLYIGNGLNGSFIGKKRPYEKRDGLCLETQLFPDSVNHNNFESCVLLAGEKYDTTTCYTFGTD